MQKHIDLGSGCGSVGRAVASDTWGLQFIGKIQIEHLFTVNCIEKMEMTKKMPGMAHVRTRWILLWRHFGFSG